MNSFESRRMQDLRARAETVLAEAGNDAGLPPVVSDIKSLLHDLSVYQIELAMQNDELRLAQIQIEKARDEYVNLYNRAPVGYLSLDRHGMILKHNQTFGTMLEKLLLTYIGTSVFSFMHPEDRVIFLARYKAFFKAPAGKNIDVRFCRQDGSLFWARLSGRSETLLSEKAAPKEILLLTVTDIVNEKRAEDELRVARDAANAANKAKSQFLSNMSHEIRTPLNGIFGMAQLLDGTELTSEQREYVEIINVSSRNLTELINSILDLSKIEAGRMDLELTDFSLTESLWKTVHSLAPVARLKGLDLRLEMSPVLPGIVTGDELRLNQIVTNLVSNSIKFTKQGQVIVSAAPSRLDDGTFGVDIDVSDTGIGIPDDCLDLIFKPFVQADMSTTRQYGGTGLGLAICRKLVDLMGGSIKVDSSLGKGSQFSVTIPLSIPAATAKSVKHKAEQTDPFRPLTILLAEDNETNRLYISKALKKKGHTVLVANDGLSAVDIWRKSLVDCILMDINMPLMGGDEATRIIRADEADSGKRTRILAVTAFALSEDKERFKGVGFDAYLTKPLMLDQLYPLLQE
jgi:PAS domain S-box-containing protein